MTKLPLLNDPIKKSIERARIKAALKRDSARRVAIKQAEKAFRLELSKAVRGARRA